MNISTARPDLGPVQLAVREFGCAARPDLDPLATKSSQALRDAMGKSLEVRFERCCDAMVAVLAQAPQGGRAIESVSASG